MPYRFVNKDHSLVFSDTGAVIAWDPKTNAPQNLPHLVQATKAWREAGSPAPEEFVEPTQVPVFQPTAEQQGPPLPGLPTPEQRARAMTPTVTVTRRGVPVGTAPNQGTSGTSSELIVVCQQICEQVKELTAAMKMLVDKADILLQPSNKK